MNSLEQIPEEKENMEILSKTSKLAYSSQKNSSQKVLQAANFNSVSAKKNQLNTSNKNILTPTQINTNTKLINKSKSLTQGFKSVRAMPSVVVPEPISIEDLEDQLETLILHQKQCQSESKYVEAEMAKQRVKELKVLLEKRTKEDIKSRHSREINEIQKAYLEEMDQFNSFWDKKVFDYDENSSKIEKELISKQEVEMDSFINDLEKSLDIRPKDSTELLNLRKVEAELAKNEDYMQAHVIKQKIFQVERDEMEKYQFERQKRMKNLISQLKVKHTTELKALQKRIQAGKEEQVKLRSIEFERLLQKFMIAKKDLQQTQVNETIQYSKAVKLGSVVLASKQVSQSQISNASFQKNLAIIKRPDI
ncbi:hypothetical protein ABPG74_003492 [Tetrahymena malaccensis]